MDGWKCPKCGQEFKRLSGFDAHKCKGNEGRPPRYELYRGVWRDKDGRS